MVYREEREGIIQTYLPVTECKASFDIVDLYGTDEDMLKSQIQRLADHLQGSLDLENTAVKSGAIPDRTRRSSVNRGSPSRRGRGFMENSA